jgi:hypothetical protein
MAALSGCADKKASAAAADDHGDEANAAVLFLNLTIGNQTFAFSSSSLTGNATGHATHGATGSATTTNTTASANTTAGNKTAAGNATVPSGPSGPAPLNVSVTLGARNLPEGDDAVSWRLAFDDAGKVAAPAGNATGNGTGAKASGPANGTTLPATVQHTYESAGLHNLTFTLLAGNTTLGTLRAAVNVTAAQGNATAFGPVPDPIVIEGSAIGFGGEGSSDETFELPTAVATMTITLEYTELTGAAPADNDLDWAIAGPGGESGGGENSGPEAPVTFELPTTGTWTVTIIPFVAVGPVDYTITVTFT